MSETLKQFRKDVLGESYTEIDSEKKPETIPAEPTSTELKSAVPDSDPIKEPASEISDEELKKLLVQRGIVKSIDELAPKLTEEERQAQIQKKQNDALAWGLQNGKFKREEFEELTKVQQKKVDLLIDEFTASLREKHPDFTEDDIQDAVSRYTLSDLDDTDLAKIHRQQELLQLADSKVKNKYSHILNIDKDYEEYERGQAETVSFSRKLEAALPVYQNDVTSIVNSFKNIDILVEDKDNPANNIPIQFTFNDNELKEIETAYLNKEQAVSKIKQGYSPDALKEEVRLVLLGKHFEKIIAKSAKDYNSIQKEKYLNGRKGIIEPKSHLDISDSDYRDTSVLEQFRKDVLGTESPN